MRTNPIRAAWQHLPTPHPRAMLHNLWHNWYFPLSALAFFWAQVQWLVEPEIWHVSLTVATVCMLVVALQVPSLWQVVRRHGCLFHFWALLTAGGILLRDQRYIARVLEKSDAFQAWAKNGGLRQLAPVPDWANGDAEQLTRWISCGLALLGFVFVYLVMAWFLEKLLTLLSEAECFTQLRRWEWALYGLLAAALVYAMARIFLATQAFYVYDGGGYDVIYTSDSGTLMYNMGYLFLTFPENDLRQPLFALFAAPFVGAPYFLAAAIGLSESWLAIFVNSVQVLVLTTSNLLLARLLKLAPLERVGFMLVTSVCYAQSLAVLMMEQYIVAYFWLMLSLVLICRSRDVYRHDITGGYNPSTMALYGAGSTLLTSFFWLPMASGHTTPRRALRWFGDMIALGLGYVALLLACGRFDVLATIAEKIESLGKFTGAKVSLTDRINQYSGFIHDIFLAPAAGVGTSTMVETPHVSWMLEPIESLNITGVIILTLALVSAVIGYRNRLSRMALAWILFSMIVLVVLGWGTQENGLILYALYFGWAYAMLLLQLLLCLTRKLRAPWLFTVFCILIAILLAGVNLQGLSAMVHYGIECFPN